MDSRSKPSATLAQSALDMEAPWGGCPDHSGQQGLPPLLTYSRDSLVWNHLRKVTLDGVNAHLCGMVTNGKKFHTRRSQLISMPVSPSSLPAWYCGVPRALPFRCSSNNAYVHISSNNSRYLYSLCNAPATLLSTLHIPTN